MKYFVIAMFLVASTLAEDLTTDKLTKQLQDGITAADQAQIDAEHEAAVKKFEEDMQAAVAAHKNSIKPIEIGEFVLRVQDNCNLVLPEKPEKPTVHEKECIKAVFNAETTAELVAKATPLNPPSVRMVMGAVNKCELQVSWVKEFEIYNECWGEEVPAKYQNVIGPVIEKLKDQGYEQDEETGKWVKKSGVTTINLEESKNKDLLA